MAAETYYLIVINDDGSLTSYTELPETLPEVTRKATNYDVYDSSRQIVEEFDRDRLVNKVLSGLIQVLMPKTETPQDRVKDALKKRGIDPDSVEPVE
jgi:hypothetical protein